MRQKILTFVLRNTRGLADRVLVAHTSPCGSLVDAGRFSRSTMCKTAFYACVLLLAPIGEQLSPSRLMKIVRGFLVRNGKGATTGWIESIHMCALLLIATHSYPSSPLPCSQVTVWFRRRTHKVRTATRRPMTPVVLLGAWTASPKSLRSSYTAVSSTCPAYSLRRNVCVAVL